MGNQEASELVGKIKVVRGELKESQEVEQRHAEVSVNSMFSPCTRFELKINCFCVDYRLADHRATHAVESVRSQKAKCREESIPSS